MCMRACACFCSQDNAKKSCVDFDDILWDTDDRISFLNDRKIFPSSLPLWRLIQCNSGRIQGIAQLAERQFKHQLQKFCMCEF